MQLKATSRSLKVNGIGDIRQATYRYDVLLVFHCINVSVLYCFRDTVTYLPKFKEVT